MRPGPADPAPLRRLRLRNDLAYLAGLPRPALHAGVAEAVRALYPARRSAGVLAMLVFLTVQCLATGTGVSIGHGELAERFGVGRRTVTRRLGEWRDRHRMIDRKRRGRHGAGVTWWAPSNELIMAVAARCRAGRRRTSGGLTRRHALLRKRSQSQGANLPQVAALRAAGTGGAAADAPAAAAEKHSPVHPPGPPGECFHGYELGRMRCPEGCVPAPAGAVAVAV